MKAILAVYDTLADWEVGYLSVELRTGRFTGIPVEVVSVAERPDPVTTMGGLTLTPTLTPERLEAGPDDLLVLAGAGFWDRDPAAGAVWTALAADFLAAGRPVAAICGATAGLARAGLLDERDHTSAAREYLAATGYRGTDRYRDERAVVDGDLVTAGPQSPAHFAAVTLGRLGLMDADRRRAYLGVFVDGDARHYAGLTA